VVLASGLFLLIYWGAEVSAGGYLYAYAVIQDLATETSAALLTSVFWGALTFGAYLQPPGLVVAGNLPTTRDRATGLDTGLALSLSCAAAGHTNGWLYI
jgi:hypothetical protein